MVFKGVESIESRVALSFVDIEGAVANLDAEAPVAEGFDAARRQAEDAWDAALNSIQIGAQDPDERTVFYTAMYHNLTVPNLASDVDGRYRGTDLQVHQGDVASPVTRFTPCGTPSGDPPPAQCARAGTDRTVHPEFHRHARRRRLLADVGACGQLHRLHDRLPCGSVIADAWAKGYGISMRTRPWRRWWPKPRPMSWPSPSGTAPPAGKGRARACPKRWSMPLTTLASPAWQRTWGRWRLRSVSGSGPKVGETCSIRTTDSCSRGMALLGGGL